MACLGLALLLPRPRRVPTLAFGSFAILWGAHILFGNLSRLAPNQAASQKWTFLYLAPLVVLYLPLLYFASFFSRGTLRKNPVVTIPLLLAPAAIGALAIVLKPGWFHEGFAADGTDRWGPLFPTFVALFFLALDVTLLALARAYARADNQVHAKRALAILVALGLFVSYTSFESLFLFAVPLVTATSTTPAEDAIFAALAIIGGILVLAISALLAKRKPLNAAPMIAAGLFGVLSGLSPDLETLGLWRTASVALIAYAILRFELFDIDVKLKRGAIAALLLAIAALAALALEQGLERVLGSTGLAITITQFALFGGVVAVLMKAPQASRRLGERVLPSLQAPGRLDARRLEVYEAALAQSAGQDEFLADLRQRLGVSDAEHALLARLVAGAPRSAARVEPGARVSERYLVESLLGEGASGAAWLATDEMLGRRVVLKTLHARVGRTEAASRAFLREARVLASLDHPNVVRVHDFGYSGETPFLVLEFVDSGTLFDRIERGALPLAEGERLIREVLSALSHIHARGVLHRDLKPANVLLTRDGHAKLADFGLALGEDAHETQVGLAPPGPRGTPATMSPEAVRGLPALAAGDVYSAGAVLYQLVTGQSYLAFEGKTRAEMHRAILEDPPRPAPVGSDARLLRVALRALNKDLAERFASAEEMRVALDEAVVSVRVS